MTSTFTTGRDTATPVGAGERILLVEDDDALRVGTARRISKRGYDVLVASDGIEALEIFDHEPGTIRLVVTDIGMPHMRGDELARRLVERDPDVGVIFMSGCDVDHAPLTGRLLSKPVATDTLLDAIRQALDAQASQLMRKPVS